MKKHADNAEVQRYGCYALNHLSYYSLEVQQMLASLGVGQIFKEVTVVPSLV